MSKPTPSTSDAGLIAAYLGLTVMAVVPIVFGSISSKHEASKEGSSAERMSTNDAYLFPLIGSATLLAFCVLFKFFNPAYINYLLTAYFSVFGVYAVGGLIEQAAEVVLSEEAVKRGQFWMSVGGTEEKPRWRFELTALRIASGLVAIALTTYYVMSKNWVASNILGMAFATSAISLIHLDSFKTGAILLGGLFFYDIFWVFGTPVMVNVAKSLDIPIKLLFPRNLQFLNPKPTDFCMLGLGDIVIPGVFVALCHRFDILCPAARFRFFSFSLGFYVLGLATTMAVMHVFKAAQPALLYLSPACIFSVFLCAQLNGNLKQVYEYEAEDRTASGDRNGTDEKNKSTGKKVSSPAKRTATGADQSPVVAIESLATPRRARHNKSE